MSDDRRYRCVCGEDVTDAVERKAREFYYPGGRPIRWRFWRPETEPEPANDVIHECSQGHMRLYLLAAVSPADTTEGTG